jgi:hypothetical protein
MVGLTYHHERRKKDRLQRDDERQLRPRVRLDEQHPNRKQGGVDVDERHRPGERGDGVRESQLQVGGPVRPLRLNHRVR